MKKLKNSMFYVLTALVLCMGAFFTPIAAHAQADTTPPNISAVLQGSMLHIEASDDLSGVEAVFIGAVCITWNGEDAMDVSFRDYVGTRSRSVGVYAVDVAGNRSATVEIQNPFFEAAVFTPDGQATVLDNATDEDGKEFYTFTTPEGNIFYLVIDRERDSDNVYFLNAVTEQDLYALAEKDRDVDTVNESAIPEIKVCTCTDRCEAGMVDVSCPVCVNDLTACVGKEVQQTDTDVTETSGAKKESSGTMIFVLLAVAAVGGAGYYLKIYKPKHELDDAEDLDDLLDNGDEPEVSEEEADFRAARQESARQEFTDQEPTGQELTGKAVTEPEDGEESAVYGDYRDYPDDDYSGDDYFDEPGQEE